MTCQKIRYKSEHAAKRALHQQRGWGAGVCRIYLCECGYWHLTSEPDYRMKRKKKYNRKKEKMNYEI